MERYLSAAEVVAEDDRSMLGPIFDTLEEDDSKTGEC